MSSNDFEPIIILPLVPLTGMKTKKKMNKKAEMSNGNCCQTWQRGKIHNERNVQKKLSQPYIDRSNA